MTDLPTAIDTLGETAMSLIDHLRDQRDEYREILHDLCMDESERRAIGGGPGWQERHAATWARAFEKFEV